jgi:O-antigen/teichoic acid export membrane protein
VQKRLFGNSLHNLAGIIVRIATSIISIPLLIRLLGLENYGIWVLGSTIVQSCIIADFGFSTATTVFLAKDIDQKDGKSISETLLITCGGTLILALCAATILYTSSCSIASQFVNLESDQQILLSHIISIGCIAVISNLVSQSLTGVANAYYRYDLTSRINILQSILLNIGQIVIAWAGGSAFNIMQFYALISVILLSLNVCISRKLLKSVKLSITLNPSKTSEILKYSFSIWITALGGVLFARGDKLIVGFFLDSKTLGMYSSIVEISGSIYSFSAIPIQPLIPEISSYFSKTKIEKNKLLKSTLDLAFDLNSLLACVVFTPLFFFSDLIFQIFIGVQYYSQINVFALRISLVIYTISCFKSVGFYILMSKSVKYCMYIQTLTSVATLVCISLGSINYGIVGAVLGNMVVLITLAYNFFAMHSINFSYFIPILSLRMPVIYILSVIFIYLIFPASLTTNIFFSLLGEVIILSLFFNNHKAVVTSLIKTKA